MTSAGGQWQPTYYARVGLGVVLALVGIIVTVTAPHAQMWGWVMAAAGTLFAWDTHLHVEAARDARKQLLAASADGTLDTDRPDVAAAFRAATTRRLRSKRGIYALYTLAGLAAAFCLVVLLALLTR